VEVFLPNLLGLTGGLPPLPAAEVFAEHPEERDAAERRLAAYRGQAPTTDLIGWLRA
jgi:hypothetical protein